MPYLHLICSTIASPTSNLTISTAMIISHCFYHGISQARILEWVAISFSTTSAYQSRTGSLSHNPHPTLETSLTWLNWPSIHLSLKFLFFFFFFSLHLEELFSYRTYFKKQCLKYSFSVSWTERGSRNVVEQVTLSLEVLRRFETEFEHITNFNMFFTILARYCKQMSSYSSMLG